MDFWARGAYHRLKKMAGGPKSKKGTRLTVGFDGVGRKRKKRKKGSGGYSKPQPGCRTV